MCCSVVHCVIVCLTCWCSYFCYISICRDVYVIFYSVLQCGALRNSDCKTCWCSYKHISTCRDVYVACGNMLQCGAVRDSVCDFLVFLQMNLRVHMTSTQSNLSPKLICFFHVETHKVSTSIRGGFHVLLHKPCHEEEYSTRSSCTAPEWVRKRSKFG